MNSCEMIGRKLSGSLVVNHRHLGDPAGLTPSVGIRDRSHDLARVELAPSC